MRKLSLMDEQKLNSRKGCKVSEHFVTPPALASRVSFLLGIRSKLRKHRERQIERLSRCGLSLIIRSRKLRVDESDKELSQVMKRRKKAHVIAVFNNVALLLLVG